MLYHLFLYRIRIILIYSGGFPNSTDGKESTCNAGDPSVIPGSGRSAGEGVGYPLQYSWASLVAQLIKNPSAMWETWVRSLDWEDTLEKGKTTCSSILAWGIRWTIESMGSQRVQYDWVALWPTWNYHNIVIPLQWKSLGRSDSLQPHRLYSPWNSPGQNTGMGSLSFLQGVFPIQGSNPGLPHYRQIINQLSHQGIPQYKIESLKINKNIWSFLWQGKLCAYELSTQGMQEPELLTTPLWVICWWR